MTVVRWRENASVQQKSPRRCIDVGYISGARILVDDRNTEGLMIGVVPELNGADLKGMVKQGQGRRWRGSRPAILPNTIGIATQGEISSWIEDDGRP